MLCIGGVVVSVDILQLLYSRILDRRRCVGVVILDSSFHVRILGLYHS